MITGVEARFVGIGDLTEAPSVAVVVDVMRAFTAAAWAFGRGAERVVLAGTLEEALALKAGHPDWVTLKDGPPAPGFDAVNSPGALQSADLGGRTVVQKTTYGTAGALAARGASLVLCASFVVAEATARLLQARASGFQGVHADDVALCLELDRFPFAMVAAPEDSLLVLRPRPVPEPPCA
jgi:2-phosphosulfolactate phosphatase